MRGLRTAAAAAAAATASALSLATLDCSLEGLADGTADASPDSPESDACFDLDVGAVPLSEQNHPPGDGAAFPDSALHECYVEAGTLFCANAPDDADSEIYLAAYYDSGIVNHLTHDFSFFKCWTTGEIHKRGGRSYWYFTIGGTTRTWGFAPGNELWNNDYEQTSPSFYGITPCPTTCGLPGVK